MEYIKKCDEDFSLTFTEINYEVKIKDKETNEFYDKKILNNVNGQFKSGELTAIMGPSGSGKTSLMNFITSRIHFGNNTKHSGNIYINSQEIQFDQLSDYSSYVMQDDVLFHILTPYECLKMAIRLKKLVEDDQVENCIHKFLDDLQIIGCKDTLIGNAELKGISGGERKRVSIGVELVSSPTILFLDEPTSGLDSQTSKKVVTLLKKLAVEKNIIVACTIHQPSSNIFTLFDQLIILERGNIIYNDVPTNITDYFQSINKPLKLNANPADSFMKVLEENTKSINKEEANYFIGRYEPYIEKNKKRIKDELETSKKGINIDCKNNNSASFSEATGILINRSWLNFIRNPSMLKQKIGFTLIFGFMIASVFWKLDPDTYDGISGRIGFAFFIAINVFMSQVMGSVLSFPTERPVFIREYSNKLYSVESYYTAKNLVETPIILFFMMLFTIIIYFTSGFRTDGAEYFFIFLGGLLLHALVAQSIGYAVGTLFASVGEAMSIVSLIMMSLIIFAGNLINEDSMPRFLFWLKYISPLKYANEIFVTNEFDNNDNITYGGGAQKTLDSLNFDIGMNTCFIIISCMAIALRFMPMFFLKLMIKKTG